MARHPSSVSSLNPSRVAIWGSGGHAAVVAEIMREDSSVKLAALLVDPEWASTVPPHLRPLFRGGCEACRDLLGEGICSITIAVGDNRARLRITQLVRDAGMNLRTVRHPRSWISHSACIGDGVVVAAMAAISANARIGDACIINTHASVDHDCQIGRGVHIAPGACLAGGVRIGEGAFIGAGAVVRDRIVVGANSIIGAGSVVIRDVADDVVVVGNPTRWIRNIEKI